MWSCNVPAGVCVCVHARTHSSVCEFTSLKSERVPEGRTLNSYSFFKGAQESGSTLNLVVLPERFTAGIHSWAASVITVEQNWRV